MDLGLKGRGALVAAASKGLGRACAEALIAEGADVFISSRDAASIESTAKQIGAAGWGAADVSKPGDPEALVGAAVARLPRPGLLVVNARRPPPGTFPIKLAAASAPMGRLGDPAEFGAACAFLCSKQAGYITGQTLGIDGGTLLGVH